MKPPLPAASLSNRLSRCVSSPYLLQHASNPVHWIPWSSDLTTIATDLNRPIFLSIGYASCHWCHVMDQESFQNENVAKLMNDHFINVKVDKEERPDIDRVYMNYVQARTGSGGWPLSVFMTPGLIPFMGGTYYPAEDRDGQIGLTTLLQRVHAVWAEDPAAITSKSNQLFNLLKSSLEGDEGAAEHHCRSSVSSRGRQLYDALVKQYQVGAGGFSHAPKFPCPVYIESLLALSSSSQVLEPQERQEAVEMALSTLHKICRGGIHDHLAGGFCRYSVDELWHVPHFEKMLYDNAQLLHCLATAFMIRPSSDFARRAHQLVHYIQREMMHRSGAFFSSQDADSLPSFTSQSASSHPVEGAYYVVTLSDVQSQLPGLIGDVFAFHYHIKEEGNCNLSPLSDPHHQFAQQNVLIELGDDPIGNTARQFKLDESEVRSMLRQAEAIMLQHRVRCRPPPSLDDKIITSWNGMMISALAQCHRAFGLCGDGAAPTSNFLSIAEQAMSMLNKSLFDDQRRLLRSVRFVRRPSSPSTSAGNDGVGRGPSAFAEDYAWMIAANLDLYAVTGSVAYIDGAIDLQDQMDRKFLRGNRYLSSDPADDPSVPIHLPDLVDSTAPSANSVAQGNLFRLASIIDGNPTSTHYIDSANAMCSLAESTAAAIPNAMPLLISNSIIFARVVQVVISCRSVCDPAVKAFQRELFKRYLPGLSILYITPGDVLDHLSRLNSTVRGLSPRSDDDAAVLHLCTHKGCHAPITTVQALAEQLDQLAMTG